MKYVLGLIVAAIIAPQVNAEEAINADHYAACLIGMALIDDTFYHRDVDSASIKGCEALGSTIAEADRLSVIGHVEDILNEVYETRIQAEDLEDEARKCRTY